MADSPVDESWIGDKVLERLGGVTPQAATAGNNPDLPVTENSLPPTHTAPSYPSAISGSEMYNMGSKAVPFQGRPTLRLHQAQNLLPFPASKGQITGHGVALTQLPENSLLSSEPALVPARQGSNTLLKRAIHISSTAFVAGSSLGLTTFARTTNQSHLTSPTRCDHSPVPYSTPHNLDSTANPSLLLNSSKPSHIVSPSEGVQSAPPADCFYIDTAGSPRLRPSLRISNRLGAQQTDTPRSPKAQVDSIGAGSKTQNESGMSRHLGQRTGNSQKLPIRSMLTEVSPKLGSVASHLADQIITAPSQPRAMREVKGPETKPTKAMESCGAGQKPIKLREVDLTKWPCRTCQFVHRGNGCETICIGCGSKSPDRHDSRCPYKNKKRLEGFNYSTAKREGSQHVNQELKNSPSELFANSITTKLSVECQKRGFNPEFHYYGNDKTGEFMADLRVKDTIVSGEGRVHRSQKEARDFLAEKGLKVVLLMNYSEPARRSTVVTRNMSRYEDCSFDKPLRGATGEPSLLKHHLVARARARSRSGPPSADAEPFSENNSRMDVDKSDEQLGKNRAESSPNIVSNSTEVASLPTNINVQDVPDVVERNLFNGTSSITFNLPANVSTEIAEAYGRGFAMGMRQHPHMRSRSRSRSPPRDRSQTYRDYRARDEYNRSGRLHARDEYRPLRDEYRVTRDREIMYDRSGKTGASARLRLSPPADLKSQRHIKEEASSPNAHRLDRHYRN